LRIRYRNMFAEIEVSDTGFGIRPEDQARIFEPFERGEQPNGAAVPGTGLGLTITKMLVQVMGGEINLTSEPDKGSVFKARLLLSEVTYPTAPPKPHSDIRGYRGRRRSIIIADDDRTHCAIVTEVLGPLGFSVIVADSGIACLNMAREHQPDLVLLDVAMPGMSGWDVAAQLRERVSPSSRIMMLSGNAFEIDAHRSRIRHYDAVQIKPFYVGSLLQTIADLLEIEWIVRPGSDISDDEQPLGATANDVAALVMSGKDLAGKDLAGKILVSKILVSKDQRMPELRELLDLRQLGEIGYVRGIREKLSDVASQSQDYRWLVDRLEPLSRDLDFPRYIALLSELIEQEQGA
jgi:CheY-like chemotaxis protein